MSMRKRAIFLTAAVMMILSGCYYFAETYIGNYYSIRGFGDYRVSDVGFIPFVLCDSQTDGEKIVQNVNRIFIAELQKHNWYRVHLLSAEDARDFNKLKNVDAVIQGEILYYKGIEPFKVGLSARMQYINTQQTIWSAYFIFDASAKDVINHVKAYYYNRQYPIHPMWGYQEMLVSVNKFVEFTCNKIIDTMRPGMNSHLMKRVRFKEQVGSVSRPVYLEHKKTMLETKNIDRNQSMPVVEVMPSAQFDLTGMKMRALQEDLDKTKQESDIIGRKL